MSFRADVSVSFTFTEAAAGSRIDASVLLGEAQEPILQIDNAGGTTRQRSQTTSGTVMDAAGAVGEMENIFDGATLIGAATVAADGTWSTVVNLSAAGDNVITARTTDSAGCSGVSASVTFTLQKNAAAHDFNGDGISDILWRNTD